MKATQYFLSKYFIFVQKCNYMEKIYIKEVNELQRIKAILEDAGFDEKQLRPEYEKLVENFEEAVGQMRLITKVSDKIQKKLDKVNASLDQKNQELDFKNKELTDTIKQLTEARAGKIATTIVLILAMALFLIEEILIEPFINQITTNQWVGIGIKLLLVISLKPIESVLENVVLNFIYRQQNKKHIQTSDMKPSIGL